jgi:glycosyltransferase involved in cell wall biosynthesis
LKRKKKIVHIITRLDMGGSAQNTLLTISHLDPGRYEVALIKGTSRESGMAPEEVERVENKLRSAMQRGAQAFELPTLVRRISPTKDIRAFFSLLSFLRNCRPEILHTHTSKAGTLGRLAGWLARVPIIIHTPHGHVFYGYFGHRVSRFFLLMEKLLGRITQHVVALTPAEARDYLAFGVVKQEGLSIIHSGVDLGLFQGGSRKRYQKRIALGIPPTAQVVGFVGWLLPIKGVSFLIRAMAGVVQQFPQSRLVLVGKGEQYIQLRQQTENLGLSERVCFLGWRRNIHEIMPCFDLLVLPSLNEGMGRVLVEAMAAGIPVVGSRVGGIPDLVKDGKNGLLVPPADEVALEQAILDLLRHESKRKRMGAAGLEISQYYSLEAMVGQLSALYEILMRKRQSESA